MKIQLRMRASRVVDKPTVRCCQVKGRTSVKVRHTNYKVRSQEVSSESSHPVSQVPLQHELWVVLEENEKLQGIAKNLATLVTQLRNEVQELKNFSSRGHSSWSRSRMGKAPQPETKRPAGDDKNNKLPVAHGEGDYFTRGHFLADLYDELHAMLCNITIWMQNIVFLCLVIIGILGVILIILLAFVAVPMSLWIICYAMIRIWNYFCIFWNYVSMHYRRYQNEHREVSPENSQPEKTTDKCSSPVRSRKNSGLHPKNAETSSAENLCDLLASVQETSDDGLKTDVASGQKKRDGVDGTGRKSAAVKNFLDRRIVMFLLHVDATIPHPDSLETTKSPLTSRSIKVLYPGKEYCFTMENLAVVEDLWAILIFEDSEAVFHLKMAYEGQPFAGWIVTKDGVLVDGEVVCSWKEISGSHAAHVKSKAETALESAVAGAPTTISIGNHFR